MHDRIEVRICSDEPTENEDTPVEVLEYSICAIGLLVYTCINGLLIYQHISGILLLRPYIVCSSCV